jgi:L-lactate dehydrogenase (cytochrome)
MSGSLRKLEPPRVVNIADLRRLAERRLPKVIFDYMDGGAEDEITVRENCQSFQDVTFRPRQAVATAPRKLASKVLGAEIAFPALLAPVGYSRMFHPDGEAGAARAAGKAGIGYILSTISGYKLEEVKAATTGPCWFQLYLVGGRGAAEAGIARARKRDTRRW